MKTLCLIRHAKSSWTDPKMDDKDRPIDPRGETDAAHLAEFLLSHDINPDLVLVSPAKRTQMTSQILAKNMHIADKKLKTIDTVYQAAVEDLLHLIQQTDDHVNSLIIIGHNPGLSWLANYLADAHHINLPTCGAYAATFDTDKWQEVTIVEGKTIFVELPKHDD